LTPSVLLAATEDLRGIDDAVEVLLGLGAVLDRVAGALAVEGSTLRVAEEAWMEVALGVMSLRRTIGGLFAGTPAPEPQAPRASPEEAFRGLLR